MSRVWLVLTAIALVVAATADARRPGRQSPTVVAPKVSVSVYIESFCPDCQQMIKHALWPAFHDKALDTIADLHIVPFGNARETLVNGSYVFTCQHGDKECYGNVLETCAISLYPDVHTHLAYIACLESHGGNVLGVAQWCAQYQGLSYPDIVACANSSVGNQLEHQMAVLTNALSPPHQWVPWVTVNGQHVGADDDGNPIKAICKAFTGATKPEACFKVPVDFYYESLCPGCRQVFTTMLYPALYQQGLLDIVDFNPVPYGNTQRKLVNATDREYKYTCQHGPVECALDVYEECAFAMNWEQAVQFAFCIETSNDTTNAKKVASACAQSLQLDFNALTQCFNEDAQYVQDLFANATEALNPPHQWVPWLVIDGQHSESADGNPVPAICAAYTGYSAPAVCQQSLTSSPPKTKVAATCPETHTSPAHRRKVARIATPKPAPSTGRRARAHRPH